MKKWIFSILAVLVMPMVSHASVFDIYRASFTNTTDTFAVIYSSPAVLYSICIGSTTTTVGGNISILNSAFPTRAVVSTGPVVDTTRTQIGCLPYNIYLSSGLAYTNTGNATIGIMWNPWSH